MHTTAGLAAPGSRSSFLPEARGLLQLALPIIVQNLAYMGMQFTDTVMAGRLSAADLAGVAVGGAVWMPVHLLLLGIILAVSPSVAHQYGARQLTAVGTTLRQACWLAVLAGTAGLTLMQLAGPLLTLIGIEGRVHALASGYAAAVALGMPFYYLYYALRAAAETLTHIRPLLVIAVCSVLLNIPINYMLIYGAFGLPQLGAVGCGYATALVQAFMFLAMLACLLRAPRYRPFAFTARFEWPRWAAQRELLKLGAPIGVMITMEGGLFSAAALMLGTLGAVVVAGHQVALNWAGVMFMVPLGLGMAVTVRVGQALGRSDPVGARHAGRVGILCAGGFEILSALAMLLFRHDIAALYTRDPQVAHLAAQLIVFGALFQLSDGIQATAAGVLRGYKDTRFPALLTVLAYWVIGFPLAWYLGLHTALGPRGVWIGLITGLTVAAVLLVWRFSDTSRILSHSGNSAYNNGDKNYRHQKN